MAEEKKIRKASVSLGAAKMGMEYTVCSELMLGDIANKRVLNAIGSINMNQNLTLSCKPMRYQALYRHGPKDNDCEEVSIESFIRYGADLDKIVFVRIIPDPKIPRLRRFCGWDKDREIVPCDLELTTERFSTPPMLVNVDHKKIGTEIERLHLIHVTITNALKDGKYNAKDAHHSVNPVKKAGKRRTIGFFPSDCQVDSYEQVKRRVDKFYKDNYCTLRDLRRCGRRNNETRASQYYTVNSYLNVLNVIEQYITLLKELDKGDKMFPESEVWENIIEMNPTTPVWRAQYGLPGNFKHAIQIIGQDAFIPHAYSAKTSDMKAYHCESIIIAKDDGRWNLFPISDRKVDVGCTADQIARFEIFEKQIEDKYNKLYGTTVVPYKDSDGDTKVYMREPPIPAKV